MVISSRSNPLYQNIRHLLQSSQVRKQKQLAVIEGIHLALAAQQCSIEIEHWIVSEDYLKHGETKKFIDQLRTEKTAGKNISIDIFKAELFAQLSQLHTPNFILGLVKIPEMKLPLKITGDAIILDAIQDAGNVGSILRSAAAANINTVMTTKSTASIWSSKVLRAAMGAHFKLHIIENKSVADILKLIKTPILATAISSAECEQTAFKQKILYEFNLKSNLTWIFGNEGQGVSKIWLDASHYYINIPISGGVESLNVAAAAAICLFEQQRQRNNLS